MKKKIKILIADSNSYKAKKLEEAVSKDEDFEVFSRVQDGEAALESIKKDSPDVVLLDLILPKIDGFELIKYVKEDTTITKKPIIIAVTNIERQDFATLAINMGIDYYMINPDYSIVSGKIRQLLSIKNMAFNNPSNLYNQPIYNDAYVVVTNALREIGIPAHIKGYTYLRDGILESLKSDHTLSVTKELYPMIAKRNNTTSNRVERAIRHAIEVAWNRGNVEKINAMFGFTVDPNRGKPTNSEFVKTLVDNIRLQNL